MIRAMLQVGWNLEGRLGLTNNDRYVNGATAGLEGAYYLTSEGGVGGKPLEYTLVLKGDWVDGVGVGAVDLLRVTLRSWR